MFCGYCGQQLPDEARFCKNCGASLVRAQEAIVHTTKLKLNAGAEVYGSLWVRPAMWIMME